MKRYVVGKVDELGEGSRRIIQAGSKSIGVFNVDGEYFAVRNSCPHQGGPICRGTVRGTMLASPPHEYIWGMEGSVLACPWHGWEFDLRTGESTFDPKGVRVKTYDVGVEKPPPVETFEVAVHNDLVVLFA